MYARWCAILLVAGAAGSPNFLGTRSLSLSHTGRIAPRHQRKASMSLARTVPAALLPGHHPLVENALSGMEDEVQELRRQQAVTNEAQGRLLGAVNGATLHMNDGGALKHAIAQKEALLRGERRKENMLHEGMRQVKKTHRILESKMHRNLDPKLDAARARLKKKQEGLRSEQQSTKYWQDQEQKVKEQASEMVKDEEASQQRFSELKGQTAWLEQQKELAGKKFEYDNQMASEEVRSLKYATEQREMEMSRLQAAENAANGLERGAQEGSSLREMEQVEDARRAVREKQDEAQNWKDNENHIRAQAEDMIKENTTSHQSFSELEAQAAWSKQQQGLAEKQYKLKRAMASQEVQTLKFVETKYEAEVSQLQEAEKAAKAAAQSVQKLDAIRANEEHKLKQFLAAGTDRLQGKMRQWEAARGKTAREIAALERQYAGWRQDQQRRSDEVARSRQASTAASQSYGDRQHDAFRKAQARAYQ